MARIHFIVNPLRPSIGLNWPMEEKAVENLTTDFEVHLTRGRLHAEILTREAIDSGAKLIVCVGGDSTLCEIANGLYRSSLSEKELPHLSLHPTLQKGDLVRSFQLRRSFQEFLQAYFDGQTVEERMDLGEIEFTGNYGQKVRRVFVNAAGFGFSSVIVQRMSRDYRMKRTKLSFLKLMIRLLPFYSYPTIEYRVDDSPFQTAEILTGLVHNGRYAARGFDFSPQSDFRDGEFELHLIRKTLPYRYFLGSFALFAGKLHLTPFVQRMKFKHLEVRSVPSVKKVKVDFDGDAWGFLPARFRVLEGALRILR